ncbi:cyclic nucleotide-binding domain-containing protein [Methyloterricola oryzae]|uniref:cyclic nucleotide-binding domain-containing protein n=1 Tax=Methyloterricola oryzae TaxID=1495050 RepID=UPI0006992A9D|nr:cyclic nucleotide-binding domain-containing protein [Methyloterricola oryzae]
MSFAVTVKDSQDLRRLIPLNILSAARFEELCAKTGIEEVGRGAVLFNQGDAKNEFVYVLSGTVSLQAGGMEMETITGGTESARFALAHQIPRKVSAIAKDRVRYIKVDSVYVNQPSETSTGSVATYEVSDIPSDAGDDWITTLLKSPIFQRLPPANLQNILSLLEEVGVRAGQEIIHQDEPGDYYYVIKRGRCALTRKPSRLAREIKLAELKTNDTFGEDALISDQPRNVTVTMTTDGILLRLNKANFLRLVKEPVISFVNMDTAQRMLQQGSRWLDVRAPDSFDEGHLPGAVNIPFFRLRMELANLSHQFKYILVCETGKVSEAAAFLLIRYEFEAYVLKGGISGVFKDQLVVGADQHAVSGPSIQSAPAPEGRVEPPPVKDLDFDPGDGPGVARNIDYTPAAKPEAQDESHIAAIRRDLAELLRGLTGLQQQAQALTESESQIELEISGVEARALDADSRLQKLVDELARVQVSLQSQAPLGSNAAELEARLAAALAEKQAVEQRTQASLKDAEDRLKTLEANSREALADVQGLLAQKERELANASSEATRLREQLQRAEASAHPAGQTAADSAELMRLRGEQAAAAKRNQELEQQIAELSSLVQEFVDQQGEGGKPESDDLQALRTELDMVRTQAEQDVMAMQRRLRELDQESARLRAELDTAQRRLLMSEAGLADATARTGSPGRGLWIAGLFAMLLAGAGAAIGVMLGTEAGRALFLGMLEPTAAVHLSVPAESPAPITPEPSQTVQPPAEPGGPAGQALPPE